MQEERLSKNSSKGDDMRLILENEFTWDGIYSIVNEEGHDVYCVDASISEDSRRAKLYPCTMDELNEYYALADSEPETYEEKYAVSAANHDKKFQRAAMVYQKRHVGRAKYLIDINNKTLGNIERSFLKKGLYYDIELDKMMVSGRVYDWDFLIVNKQEIMGHSVVSGNRLSLEYAKEEYELTLAVLLVALAGLAYDLRDASLKESQGMTVSEREPISVPSFLKGNAEGSGLEEAIELLRDGAEKIGDFGQTLADAGEKARIAGKKAAHVGNKAIKAGKKGLYQGEQLIEKIFLTEEDRNR